MGSHWGSIKTKRGHGFAEKKLVSGRAVLAAHRLVGCLRDMEFWASEAAIALDEV